MSSERDEKNRKIAEALGFLDVHKCTCTQFERGTWPDGHIAHMPDFYRSESANALVLEALIERDHTRDAGTSWIVPSLFEDLINPWSATRPDRKTAVADLFLSGRRRNDRKSIAIFCVNRIAELEADRDKWKKSAEGVAAHACDRAATQDARIDALEAELDEVERLIGTGNHDPAECENERMDFMVCLTCAVYGHFESWLKRRKATRSAPAPA